MKVSFAQLMFFNAVDLILVSSIKRNQWCKWPQDSRMYQSLLLFDLSSHSFSEDDENVTTNSRGSKGDAPL